MVPSSVYAPGNTPDWQPGSQASSVALKPYVDTMFRLPGGVKPGSVSVTLPWPLPSGVDLLAYNVSTGKWDKLTDSAWPPDGFGRIYYVACCAAASYTGPAGDVTVRMLAGAGRASLLFNFQVLVCP